VFPKIIRFLYVLVVVLMVLGYVGGVIYGFMTNTTIGLAALGLGPVAVLLYLILVRTWMEIAIVLFRIHENTERITGSE